MTNYKPSELNKGTILNHLHKFQPNASAFLALPGFSSLSQESTEDTITVTTSEIRTSVSDNDVCLQPYVNCMTQNIHVYQTVSLWNVLE